MSITRVATSANTHLPPEFIERLERRFAGTRLYAQEIEGLVMDDVDGACFTHASIADNRYQPGVDVTDVTVAVDPGGSANGVTGIVVGGLAWHCDCGTGRLPHAVILDDASTIATPDVWGAAAVQAARRHGAVKFVVERTYGGEMAADVIRSRDPQARIELIPAVGKKSVRAQPVAALYEQGRVHHVSELLELETEQTTWSEGDPESPDRMDALVHLVTSFGMVEQEWSVTVTEPDQW